MYTKPKNIETWRIPFVVTARRVQTTDFVRSKLTNTSVSMLRYSVIIIIITLLETRFGIETAMADPKFENETAFKERVCHSHNQV